MEKPLVSVVILNWNGKKWLAKCLPSFKKVKYKPFEIIVVNNGSTDNSADFIRNNFPNVKIVELKKNRGYAGANNIGVKHAKGKYILLINNDTTVTPSFLDPMVDLMEKDKSIGIIQPQIRSMIYPKLLDSVGSFFTSTGFLYHFGYMKPYSRPIYKKTLFVYSIKGACFLMRRKDFIDLGGFDEDFVCYVEETDLCHRVWLSGKKVIYLSESYIYHWGGGDMQIMTKDQTTMFRSFRNRFLSYIKNFNKLNLFKIIPILFLFSEAYITTSILKGQFKKAGGAQLGVISVLLYLPKTLRKRKVIQKKIRKISDEEIFKYTFKNPKLSYYYKSFSNPSAYKD